MLDRQMDQWALAQQALALRDLARPALALVQILQTQARLALALPLFLALRQAHHHSLSQARSEPPSKRP